MTGYGSNKSIKTIKVIFNNISFNQNLKTAWGFSCFIEGFKNNVLFDTGSDGKILLENMKIMGINPESVDVIVISHNHYDHTGGLKDLLFKNSKPVVVIPESFPEIFSNNISSMGANIRTISGPTRLFENVYSSGEMNNKTTEQSLVLDTSRGLALITGCAHPKITKIVKEAKKNFKKDIYLAAGGFHLKGLSKGGIKEIITDLKQSGVKKVAPGHCTGELAILMFKKAWGENFLEGGVGALIDIN